MDPGLRRDDNFIGRQKTSGTEKAPIYGPGSHKKAAPEGEFRSRTGLADGIGRIVGLGDKPVRTNPTDRKVVPNCDVRLNKLRRFDDES